MSKDKGSFSRVLEPCVYSVPSVIEQDKWICTVNRLIVDNSFNITIADIHFLT